jgi:GDPmannose 4,6-dehydratase
MVRRALICGISGQDGAYLAQLLLAKGYEVWGTSRDASTNQFLGLKTLAILEKVKIITMKPDIFSNVFEVFEKIKPNEIYNLSAQSSVALSFEKPAEAFSSITIGTVNQLEAIRQIDKTIKYYNAGSSECFGNCSNYIIDENSAFLPKSPYAIAKASATWYVSLYRQTHNLYACTGILFNHESSLRPENFVTMKIILAAQRIASGSSEKLKLGNINIFRDWGWAPEYVESMQLMLELDTPQDFIIATGIIKRLSDFVQIVFEEAGLDWREHVVIDPALNRFSDPIKCVANITKANKLLKWAPSITGFEVPKKMYHETGTKKI